VGHKLIPIPVGLIDSANLPTPTIDIFMWSFGDNYWPRDGGGASYSEEIVLNPTQTYQVVFTSPFITGYTKLKNQTTNTEIATTNGWATNTINGTIVSSNQDSPKIDFYNAGTLVGEDLDDPEYPGFILNSQLEVNSGGSGAGGSCFNGFASFGSYSNGIGMPPGFFYAGEGGGGVQNPYHSIFGPEYVCAGGVGSFYGSDYASGNVAAFGNFPGPVFAICDRIVSSTNLTSTENYTGSGATALDNAQVGTNAGAGAAIIKSNVPLQVVNAQAATSAGYYYYFFTQSEQFQVA
jgi:hypothetical protein